MSRKTYVHVSYYDVMSKRTYVRVRYYDVMSRKTYVRVRYYEPVNCRLEIEFPDLLGLGTLHASFSNRIIVF